MKDSIIKIENLKVSFNGINILDLKEEIEIKKGDVVGIIGANGAGKSTLVNCIINKISYDGEIERNFIKDDLGIQFQNNSYNKLMKVFEVIQIVTGKRKFEKRLRDSITDFELDSLLNKRIGNLSGGESQRLTLFLMLYLKPKLLIFDELTTGLDYQKRVKLLKMVKNYSENNTVLTITHYFEELQDWANKILVLDKGKMIFFGTIEEFKQKYLHYSIIKVKYENNRNFNEDIFEGLRIINNFDEDSNGVVAMNLEDQNNIINLLSEKSIVFELMPCSMYTLYSVSLNQWKVGVKIENLYLD